MREAVIVSYARTGLAKSGRGGFNITPPMSMAAHAIKHAVDRAKVGDADYHRDGTADVTVYTDLSDLWDELRNAD